MNSIIQKIFSNYLFRVMAAWFGVYIKDKIQASITGPVQEAQELAEQTIEQVQSIAQNMLNTVIAYLSTTPEEIYLTQRQYNALPDTKEEMKEGDLYYKKDPSKAFNIEEEQVEGSGSGEGGAA